jgi:CHAT domain-containing protein
LVQVFSHGEGEKGIWFSDRLISPAEIRTMQLNAALISLTTCESHNGEMVRNEGVRGMVEAFSRAGAKRIIASLWKIDEIASSRIMEYFYDELFKAADPDLALQRAKIRYLVTAHPQEMHPYYWAGMELFGEPTGRILPEKNSSDLASTVLLSLLAFALVFFLVVRQFSMARF